MIYLDYSANTPVSEDVLRCFCETEREFFGNPNSTHDAGKIRSYADKRDNCANVRNGFIAGAAVLYVWNVIDGIAAKGKKKGIVIGDAQLRIAPYASPQSGGIALAVRF